MDNKPFNVGVRVKILDLGVDVGTPSVGEFGIITEEPFDEYAEYWKVRLDSGAIKTFYGDELKVDEHP